MQVVPLIPRYPAWQQDCIGFSVQPEELKEVLGLPVGEGVLGCSLGVAVSSGCEHSCDIVALYGCEPVLSYRHEGFNAFTLLQNMIYQFRAASKTYSCRTCGHGGGNPHELVVWG